MAGVVKKNRNTIKTVIMCHVWSSRVMCGVHVGKEDKVTDDVQINPPSQTQALLIYQELNYIMCGSSR